MDSPHLVSGNNNQVSPIKSRMQKKVPITWVLMLIGAMAVIGTLASMGMSPTLEEQPKLEAKLWPDEILDQLERMQDDSKASSREKREPQFGFKSTFKLQVFS